VFRAYGWLRRSPATGAGYAGAGRGWQGFGAGCCSPAAIQLFGCRCGLCLSRARLARVWSAGGGAHQLPCSPLAAGAGCAGAGRAGPQLKGTGGGGHLIQPGPVCCTGGGVQVRSLLAPASPVCSSAEPSLHSDC